MEFVIIEQDGEGGAYITHIDNIEDYQSIGDGIMICLQEQDYYNMCQARINYNGDCNNCGKADCPNCII
jgi:hypothetical protein